MAITNATSRPIAGSRTSRSFNAQSILKVGTNWLAIQVFNGTLTVRTCSATRVETLRRATARRARKTSVFATQLHPRCGRWITLRSKPNDQRCQSRSPRRSPIPMARPGHAGVSAVNTGPKSQKAEAMRPPDQRADARRRLNAMPRPATTYYGVLPCESGRRIAGWCDTASPPPMDGQSVRVPMTTMSSPT